MSRSGRKSIAVQGMHDVLKVKQVKTQTFNKNKKIFEEEEVSNLAIIFSDLILILFFRLSRNWREMVCSRTLQWPGGSSQMETSSTRNTRITFNV